MEDRFLVDTEGLDGPERGPGSISVERGADPVGLMLGGLIKELVEPLRRLGNREDAGSLFLLAHGAIQATQRDFIGKAVDCGS
jgi:hypothetical protein